MSKIYINKEEIAKTDDVDSKLSTKADKASTYSKTEVDSKVANANANASKAQTTANNALPKSGGAMAEKSTISWPGNGSTTAKDGNIGGLSWAGGTDSAKIYADNDGNDNLDLALDLGDDASNHVSFRFNGTERAGITSSGHFTGTVDWNNVNGKPDVAAKTDIANLQSMISALQAKTAAQQNTINSISSSSHSFTAISQADYDKLSETQKKNGWYAIG